MTTVMAYFTTKFSKEQRRAHYNGTFVSTWSGHYVTSKQISDEDQKRALPTAAQECEKRYCTNLPSCRASTVPFILKIGNILHHPVINL